jgi:hypothetical protein
MRTLYLMTDYKGHFGEKRYAVPYRSGMDIGMLQKYFAEEGYEVQTLGACDVDLRTTSFAGRYVLCGSAQDADCLYKSYLEDVCLALELQGAILIPSFKYLRAHHNKVFMELLRDLSDLAMIKNIRSRHFGTVEELIARSHLLSGKHVVKAAGGAGSKYVRLGNDTAETVCHATRLSRSRYTLCELWDIGRRARHKGYVRESAFRRKFVVQNFVEGLRGDWKILVFADKYYVLHRATRDNDFRASGSGKFEFREIVPEGLLDYASEVFESFCVPSISIDVGYEGRQFYLIEFQCIYFGSTTIEKAPWYFMKSNSGWTVHKGASVLEKEYVKSVVAHIARTEKQAPHASDL